MADDDRGPRMADAVSDPGHGVDPPSHASGRVRTAAPRIEKLRARPGRAVGSCRMFLLGPRQSQHLLEGLPLPLLAGAGNPPSGGSLPSQARQADQLLRQRFQLAFCVSEPVSHQDVHEVAAKVPNNEDVSSARREYPARHLVAVHASTAPSRNDVRAILADILPAALVTQAKCRR